MRNMERPPLEVIAGDRSADDVDGLLREFFRSEMPKSWPELKLPAGPGPEVGRGLRVPSRWLLAASVVLLLATSLALTASFREKQGTAVRPSSRSTATRAFPLPAEKQAGVPAANSKQ